MNIFPGTHSEKSTTSFFSFNGKTGKRFFSDEKSNWLGNVNVVISDKKFGVDSTGDGIVDYYKADVRSVVDYYPGGMMMPGRNFNSTDYRFGFQGQIKTDEVYGSGNLYSFDFREQDPRIVRFWSVDPLSLKYSYWSPYAFSGNRLIDAIELEGLEPTSIEKLGSGAKLGVEKAAMVKKETGAKAACNVGAQVGVKEFTGEDVFFNTAQDRRYSAKEITTKLSKGEFSDFKKISEVDVPANSSGKISDYLAPLQDLANEGYLVVGAAQVGSSNDFHVVEFVPGEMDVKPKGFAEKSGTYSVGKTPQVLDTGREGEFASTPLSTVSGRGTIENMNFYIYNPKNETKYKKILEKNNTKSQAPSK